MFLLYLAKTAARYGAAPDMAAVEAAGYRHGVAGTYHQNIVLVTFQDSAPVCHDACEKQDEILADAAEWHAELQAAQ